MPLKLFCVKPVKYCYVDLKVTKPCKVWCFFNLWRNLNEVAISCGAKWRISFGGTGAKNSFVQLIALTIRRIHVFFSLASFFFQHDFEVFVRNVFSDASSEARMVLQSFGFTRLSLMTSQSFEFWRLFQKCWLPSKIDHS